MSKVVRYYAKPDGQFFGGWEGDPDIHEDPFPQMGYIEVPRTAPSTEWYWNFEDGDFYLPDTSGENSPLSDISSDKAEQASSI